MAGLLILSFAGYINRISFERSFIAYKVYRSKIFTPPPLDPAESKWHQFKSDAQFYWDFSGFVVARLERLKHFNPVLNPLVKEVVRRQVAGQDMEYSMHIYREIRWRLNFTPDEAATQARIADLRASLADPKGQKWADGQDPSDGSWARGIDPWYLRLYYSVDEASSCTVKPEYPLTFLDRINSPEKLTAQLNSVLYDDFTKTDEFNREELDETFSALARILFSPHQKSCYEFDPQLQNVLREFVKRWQNPVTGCWGQWMIDRQGRIWKMDDMGMTFHVVSDLHGQVNHEDLIAKRLLQLDRTAFPAGIIFDGHYENHLNWDAVKIFRYAWPSLDDVTRKQVRTEISHMLDWCLTKSYQPDGSFKVSDLDDTLGDAYYYGVSFLRETGYFQRDKRFWADANKDKDFSDSQAIRAHIEAKLKSLGLNDPKMKDAYDALTSSN
jgi:hypothetical protein